MIVSHVNCMGPGSLLLVRYEDLPVVFGELLARLLLPKLAVKDHVDPGVLGRPLVKHL